MPSILLINDNKIVSRLLQLSSQKHNYNLEEINDYTPSENAYNVIFIDSEKYDEDALNSLKDVLTFDKLGFIGDKTNTKPEGFDLVLEKPFLPTDFVNLMNENFRVIAPDDALDTIDDIEGEDELDLDNLEEMDIDATEESVDALGEMDELGLDMDDDPKVAIDMPLESETALTTGIAASLVQEDENKEELAEMVSEIDNMEEEILEEMDLDALEDEDTSDSIVDETLVKESIEEVEEELEEAEEISEEVEEAPEEVAEEVPEEVSQEVIEDDTTDDAPSLVAAAGGVAAAAVAATVAKVESDKAEEVKEELEETLNILDGVEAIETEEDYLKESEHKVEALADEFDSLNEEEVEKLMSGNEEIISEEISAEGEEKVVEAGDLEEMITRAVAKAITKEMLQEALNDMEIVVTLKSKDS